MFCLFFGGRFIGTVEFKRLGKLEALIERKNQENECLKFENTNLKDKLQTLECTHDELKLKYANLEEKLNTVNTDYDAILNKFNQTKYLNLLDNKNIESSEQQISPDKKDLSNILKWED